MRGEAVGDAVLEDRSVRGIADGADLLAGVLHLSDGEQSLGNGLGGGLRIHVGDGALDGELGDGGQVLLDGEGVGRGGFRRSAEGREVGGAVDFPHGRTEQVRYLIIGGAGDIDLRGDDQIRAGGVGWVVGAVLLVEDLSSWLIAAQEEVDGLAIVKVHNGDLTSCYC